MNTELTDQASKLVTVPRRTQASLLADNEVRAEVVKAGYGALPLRDRGDIYLALTLIKKDDPNRFGDLVDALRCVLARADEADRQDQFQRLRAAFVMVKGCPECHKKPDLHFPIGGTEDESSIVCENHDGFVYLRSGLTIYDAIESWNLDDWVGPDVTRNFFAI